MLEREIKKQITDYLKWSGYEVQLMEPQAGLVWTKGLPDLVCMKEGKTYWVEVKTPKGVQSRYQLSFEQKCKRAGVPYILARSLEDVKERL